ncbi:MAG: DNA-binding transcriptional LysR family regulator [Cognaticolwellia sp.]
MGCYAGPMQHTLEQLQVLDAIDRLGTFAKAAQELHKVPSAISYAVRSMEEQLGLTLFERLGNRTRLSPQGRRVLVAGREVLDRAHALDRLAAVMREGWEPDLHVVVDGVYPMAPLAQALRALAEAGAPTRVRLDVEYQEGVPERWQDDRADLMLILDFDPENDPLEMRGLPPLEMVLVGAQGRATYEIVVRDSAPRYRRQPKRPFQDAANVVYLSDFHAKRLALIEGVGQGWMPLHLVQSDLESGRLENIQDKRWTYNPQVVWRRDKELGRAAELFLEKLQIL